MKNLILTAIFVLTAFVLFPVDEASFVRAGNSDLQTVPPKVIRLLKQEQNKIKRKTSRRRSGYRYSVPKRKSDYPHFVPRVKRARGAGKTVNRKVDLSKVPRVILRTN